MDWVYMVVCRDDWGFIQATRQYFKTEQQAADYAGTVAPSRDATLIQMDARTINPAFIKEG